MGNQSSNFISASGGVSSPSSPGGVLVEIPTELSPTAAPNGTILKAVGGAWNLVLEESHFFQRWFGAGGVIGAQQYLLQGENIVASGVGEILTTDVTLVGITFISDVAPTDGGVSRQYTVEVLRDPTDLVTPTVLGSLLIPNGGATRFARRRDLTAALNVADDNGEYGVRIRRSAGTGDSVFTDFVVLAEFKIRTQP